MAKKRAEMELVRMRDWAAVGVFSLALGVVLCVPSLAMQPSASGPGAMDAPGVAAQGEERMASSGGSGESASAADVDGASASAASPRDERLSEGGDQHASSTVRMIDLYDTSEGVAVTVNGVAVGEAAVRWVEGALGQSAQEAAVRPEALRSAAVDYLVGLEVLRQEAASRGLSVGEDDVRAELADVRESFASEEDYSRYLQDRGVTEEALALGLESELLSARLMAQVVPEADVQVSDLAVLERLQPERAAAIAASGDGDAAAERAAASELAKLDAAQVADARAYLRQQERTRLFLEWRDTLEAAADIE